MGSTSYNSGYEFSLPLVASPKLLPMVATFHIRETLYDIAKYKIQMEVVIYDKKR